MEEVEIIWGETAAGIQLLIHSIFHTFVDSVDQGYRNTASELGVLWHERRLGQLLNCILALLPHVLI